ncbi:MAG: hypothetical protein KDC94_04995 [Aequorivita sp.]|nr:hypothetical protein [Aequorivita sp.]MCB0454658.1 hypothetical protein [Aequorivita sp.]MCB0467706.1 hypothetical protein [Aequorivita sp.]HPE83322.1 hypothetical protein [Aequorivita sp.]
MENPFKTIIADEKLPKALKEKVLNDVAAIKLILDIADLTLIKYPSSLEDLYRTTKPKKK